MNEKYVLGSLLILTLAVTGCNPGGQNNPSSNGNSESSIIQPSKDPDEITGGTFNFNDDELAQVQEIHTANQLKYLNLSKDYYDMTKSDLDACDAMGNKNVSAPNQTKLDWEFSVPDGAAVKNYTLVFSQNADLSDPYVAEGTKETSISFYNSFLGTNYFKIVANFTTSFANDKIAPEVTVMYGIERGDLVVMPKLAYKPDQNLTLTASGMLINCADEDSEFYAWRRNSFVSVGAKYQF